MVRATLMLLALFCWEVKPVLCLSNIDQICAPVPADIVFINDASGSVGSGNFDKTLRFIETLVSGFVIGPYDTQVGMLAFETDVNLQFHLNSISDRQEIMYRVSETPYPARGTNTHTALDYAREVSFTKIHGMRSYAAQVAIVITDGQSNSPPHTVTAAQMLRDSGITVFAIGVGDGPNQDELRSIASDPDDEHVFSVEDFNSLNKIKESLQQRACEAKPANMCPGKADIVFLLENSDHVGQQNLNKALELVRNITKNFFISPNAVQIGVDTFSTKSSREFSLNDYNSQLSLRHALSSIQSKSGGINTGEAIRKMRLESFSTSAGYRPGVPRLAVVVTTGRSSDRKLTLREAREAKKAGIYLLAVGVGDKRDERELEAIATRTDDFFTFQEFGSLQIERILPKLCGKIEPEKTDQPCGSQADMVFLIDSTSKTNFELLKNFVEIFVQNLPISEDKVRVAVATFASRPYSEFQLNTYNSTDDMLDALSRIEPKGGGRDTAAAITYANKVMFSERNGDRPGVPNIAVILTDGPSTNPVKTEAAATLARANDITIFTLGVGEDLLRIELNDMASEPDGRHVLTVTDFSKLNSIKGDFKDQTCKAMPVKLPPYVASAISTENSTSTSCEDKDPNCPNYSTNICKGKNKQWGMENCERYCGYCSALSQVLSSSYKCFYKGVQYDQGAKWDDKCLTCECEDARMGAYTCYSKCAGYFNLPKECKLEKKPGSCCLEPVCDFKKTYTTKDVQEHCVYNQQKFKEGDVWSVDCEFVCTCRNAALGLYSCQSRCAKYESLPDNCKLVRPPGECCEKPECKFETIVTKITGNSRSRGPAKKKTEETPCLDKISDCDQYPKDLCSPSTNSSFALDDCRKSCGFCPPDDVSVPIDVCMYKGQTYKQGESWQDGCETTCICEHASSDTARCWDNCPDYSNLPKHCRLVTVANECCKQRNCSKDVTITSSQQDPDSDEASQTNTTDILPSVCDPAEEGQSTTLTCTGLLDDCSKLFNAEWKAGGRELIFCEETSCGAMGSVGNTFDATITKVNSTLTINNVSRTSPFNMETKWSCPVCGRREGLECDKLQVYAKPENLTCVVTENMQAGEIASVTVSCSTSKVYPQAKCSFYTMKNSSIPPNGLINRPIYKHVKTAELPVYYSSQCSVSVAVDKLGEGTHSFKVYMYPDVTGGERLVTGVTPGKTVHLTFPQVSHSCKPAMVQGYFKENSTTCTCNATSAGYPRGKAQWYKGRRPVGVELKLSYIEKGHAQVYTCKAVSTLGQKVVSTFTAKFPVHEKIEQEDQRKVTAMVTASIIAAGFMIAMVFAMRARKPA